VNTWVLRLFPNDECGDGPNYGWGVGNWDYYGNGDGYGNGHANRDGNGEGTGPGDFQRGTA
jgi:hypothetical protein